MKSRGKVPAGSRRKLRVALGRQGAFLERMFLVTVNLDIYPRQALTPADFKALGRTIRRWLRLHAKQQGSMHWYDSNSLAELLKGRPPLSVRSKTHADDVQVADVFTDSRASNTAVLDAVETAPPPFCMSLVYNKIIEDRQIMANVRRALSAELVADVLIDGLSWDDPTG